MMRLSEDDIAFHVDLLRKLRTPLVATVTVVGSLLVIPFGLKLDAAANSNVPVATNQDTDPTNQDNTNVDLSHDNQTDSQSIDPREIETATKQLRIILRAANQMRALATSSTSARTSLRDNVLDSTRRVAIWAATRKFEESRKSATRPPVTPPKTDKLVLRNHAANNADFAFLLGKEVVTLRAGEEKVIRGEGAHVVRYHRGGEFGVASHSLRHGTFVFRVTSKGWRLSPVPNPN